MYKNQDIILTKNERRVSFSTPGPETAACRIEKSPLTSVTGISLTYKN